MENERMLGIVGSYIAVALENSRLYEQSRDREQRMQHDLDTAREVQRQLLPQDKRTVAGLDIASAYVPARQLAGDFYDFLPYGSGRLGIALGDVSGKGRQRHSMDRLPLEFFANIRKTTGVGRKRC